MTSIDGIVALYRFDNTWADATGNGHTGVPDGATFDDVNKKLGIACAHFDGIDDIVRVDDHADFNFGSAMSLFSWVKGPAQSAGMVASQYDAGAGERSWYLSSGLSSTNKIRVVISSDGGGTNIKVYESSIIGFNDSWNHVGFTFSSGTLKLYVNGTEDTSPNKIADVAVPSLYNSTADIVLGSNLSNNVPANYVDGLEDQLLLVNRALTNSEISYLYNGGEGRYLRFATGFPYFFTDRC